MSETQATTAPEQDLSNSLKRNNCNSILPSDALFCGACGERFQKSIARIQLPWLWPAIIIVSAIAAALAAFVITNTPACLIILMWFLFICPGMMLVRFFHLKEPAVEWILALALSFAIDAIVASILLYTGRWSPTGILGILIALSAGGAIVQLVTTRSATLPVPKLSPTVGSWKPAILLPLFVTALFIGLTVVASILSPVYTTQSASPIPALPHKIPFQSSSESRVAATSTPSPTVDAVIVMDNIDHIGNYDPHGNRYAAAQLFVNLALVGDRIGIVRITSSPEPPKILELLDIKNSGDKELIKSKLSADFFGPVDQNPTAYFTPALQTAGSMLRQLAATSRKFVLIVTDELAFSGDLNACPASPDAFHNWFCEVNALEQQGISVVLLAFTKPGNEGLLLPTKQYIKAHGGTVLPVTGGTNLAQYLTQAFNDLLKGIRPSF